VPGRSHALCFLEVRRAARTSDQFNHLIVAFLCEASYDGTCLALSVGLAVAQARRFEEWENQKKSQGFSRAHAFKKPAVRA
jgi:hypothetical protein